jgi:hypothetical protein
LNPVQAVQDMTSDSTEMGADRAGSRRIGRTPFSRYPVFQEASDVHPAQHHVE